MHPHRHAHRFQWCIRIFTQDLTPHKDSCGQRRKDGLTCPRGPAVWVGHIKCWSTSRDKVWVCNKSSWWASPESMCLTSHPTSPLPDVKSTIPVTNLLFLTWFYTGKKFESMVIDQNYIETWKISGCVLRGRSRCAGMMRRWNGQSVCPPRPSWHSELEDVDRRSLRENKDAGSAWCGLWENRIKKNLYWFPLLRI